MSTSNLPTAPVVDDFDDYFDYEPSPGTSGGMRDGNGGGADWCECGFAIGWTGNDPEGDAQARAIFAEHIASCPTLHSDTSEPVQAGSPTVPTPRDVACLHVRHRADTDALAEATIRRACRLVNVLRAAGLPPERAARSTAVFLECVVALNPQLRGWKA